MAVTPIIAAVGTAFQVAGQIGAANQARSNGRSDAAQYRAEGNAIAANAQRKAEVDRKRDDYTVAQTQAGFASSGGGTGGSAADVVADMEGARRFNEILTIAEGRMGQNRANAQGDAREAEGNAQATAGYINAATTGISGIAANKSILAAASKFGSAPASASGSWKPVVRYG